MALTNVGGNASLSNILSQGGYIALGVSGSNPQPDGTGFNEPATANGYHRVSIADCMAAPANRAVTNDEIIYFPEDTTADWGSITHFALFSAQTGGNMILYGTLTSAVSVTVGLIPVFRVNALNINIA